MPELTPDCADLGTFYAGELLTIMQANLRQLDVEQPEVFMQCTGAATPTFDAEKGMVWTRLASQYPTTGGAEPLISARISWDIPAWAYAIELGFLLGHPVIDEEGASPDPTEWTRLARRDGQYRLAILAAVQYDFPAIAKAAHAMGMIISPWAPIGPDGGYSGGIVIVTLIATPLATD